MKTEEWANRSLHFHDTFLYFKCLSNSASNLEISVLIGATALPADEFFLLEKPPLFSPTAGPIAVADYTSATPDQIFVVDRDTDGYTLSVQTAAVLGLLPRLN